MATQVLGSREMDELDVSAWSGFLPQMLDSCEMEDLAEDEASRFSPGKALRGARGLLVALSLEAGILLSAFFVWQIIRSLR